eukprot:TRINITY_DN2379_c0_g2_i4.p1 TRINITY_DN2379_c0_g2~~TRINITY_DN2379_c0_g2_i4.p1  ORF type:complete len:514 (-),score=123.00 TRINITY_DN2379_c0_g2_i4:27-1568(-)
MSSDKDSSKISPLTITTSETDTDSLNNTLLGKNQKSDQLPLADFLDSIVDAAKKRFPTSFGKIMMILSCLFNSLNAVAVKKLSYIPFAQFILIRSIIAASIQISFMLMTNPNNLHPRNLFKPKLLVFGTLCLTASGLYVLALTYLPMSQAIFMMSIYPIFSGIFSYIFLKQKPSLFDGLAAVIGLIGVSIESKFLQEYVLHTSVSYSTNTQYESWHFGVFIAIIQAIVTSSIHVSQRFLAPSEDVSLTNYHPYQIGAIAMVLWFAVRGDFSYLDLTSTEYLYFLPVSILNILANVLVVVAIKNERPFIISILGYTMIALSVGLDILLFNNLPGLSDWIGAAMIIGCAVMLMLSKNKHQNASFYMFLYWLMYSYILFQILMLIIIQSFVCCFFLCLWTLRLCSNMLLSSQSTFCFKIFKNYRSSSNLFLPFDSIGDETRIELKLLSSHVCHSFECHHQSPSQAKSQDLLSWQEFSLGFHSSFPFTFELYVCFLSSCRGTGSSLSQQLQSPCTLR